MSISLMLYIIEILVALITILIVLIFFLIKNKKGFVKFLVIALSIFAVVICTTFIIQKNRTNSKEVISFIDNVPPELSLIGDSNIIVLLGNAYKENGAIAVDETDGDLTKQIQIEGIVDTSKEGNYIITYTVYDNSGNISTKKRTVTVKDKYKKIIYLTFDDGPSAYTEELLDILKNYNVKATFFVTGIGDDSVIKREFDEGHTIALHTNSHLYSEVYSSPDKYFEDLYAIQTRVESITGRKSNIIRFPGGSSNTVSRKYDGGIKIMTFLSQEVLNRGFRYFDWNVYSGDAGETTSSEQVYINVVENLKPEISVVLQHDIKKFSIEAVPQIIEYGLQNGYTFDKITEDTPMIIHSVNN